MILVPKRYAEEEDGMDGNEDGEEQSQPLTPISVSLDTVVGIDNPRTMKLLGKDRGNIDSGYDRHWGYSQFYFLQGSGSISLDMSKNEGSLG